MYVHVHVHVKHMCLGMNLIAMISVLCFQQNLYKLCKPTAAYIHTNAYLI